MICASHKGGNDLQKGLKVEIVLWHLKDRKNFSAKQARLWIRGDITNINGARPERKKFNDAGQLLTILGRWNAEKFRAFQHRGK